MILVGQFHYFTLKVLKDQINKNNNPPVITSFSRFGKIIESLCARGIRDGVFSGVCVGVFAGGKHGSLRLITGQGRTRWNDPAEPVGPDTCFDLASLTKPLVTTLLLYHLMDRGLIDPGHQLARFIEGLPPDKAELSIGSLMSHSSGLASYHPYYREMDPDTPIAEARQRILAAILAGPLEYAPSADQRYSDLGYILLGHCIERISGQSLDTLFREKISGPLDLDDQLFFLRREAGQGMEKQYAATEECEWRGRLLRGEVHDEHCFLMGGVAGHAGLFGTAGGVLRLCERILSAWKGKGGWNLVNRDILARGLTRVSRSGSWCLGFDTPTPGRSSSGRFFSGVSVGHLGFTGTSFWIDPERDVIVVLLTNRVHPTRENIRIRQFRPWFHDRVMEMLVTNSC